MPSLHIVLGLANLGFDLSIFDIFGLLSVGGCVVLPYSDRRNDPSHWAQLISEHGVTVWNSVPAQMQMLEHFLATVPTVELFTLRVALLSGDWIPVSQPDSIRRRLPLVDVVSLGGATEAAIWSIVHPVEEVKAGWHSIPYGRPLTNQTVQVLDEDLQPRPDWVVGEIYLGGAGLALGYLGDEQRTQERFVRHPDTGERLYRTGDFGRALPTGEVEFLGRTDSQVKIRGQRVELAEIESVLQAHPAVSTAVALTEGDNSLHRRIAAFVLTAPISDAARAAADRHSSVVTAAARAAYEIGRSALALDDLHAFGAAADEVALYAMGATIRRSGVFVSPGDARSAAEVATALGTAPRHQRLVRRWLAVLTERGLLRRDSGNRFRDLAEIGPADVTARLARLEELPGHAHHGDELLRYLRSGTEHLEELLRDELDPLGVLAPCAVLATAPATPRENPINRHCCAVLVAAVRAVAQQHAGNRQLRVLEIGAGVGRIAVDLVPALTGLPVDCLCSDISQSSLDELRQTFADRDWVRYATFDVNADPRAQGLAPGSIDVIVANGLLHLTPEAPATLMRLRQLLAPAGWLAFVEVTMENLPLMVSLEFTDQLPGPTHLRRDTDQIHLDRDQWLELLADAGAQVPLHLSAFEQGPSLTGQHVFLTQFGTDREPVHIDDLVIHAAARLPAHMVPVHLEVLDDLPLTANGKVDRSALRTQLPNSINQQSTRSDDPIDELERRLIELWAEVLGHRHLGRSDDFFAVGGDSLLLARLVGQLLRREPRAAGCEFGVLLGQVLRRPTVAALAGYLRTISDEPVAAGSSSPSPLVTLADGGTAAGHGAAATPVVFVHESTGTLAPYRELVHVLSAEDSGRQVLGLEARHGGAYADVDPEELVERLAEDYVVALRESGLDRLHLVGYSMGGFVATELAKLLAESGAVVETLTVISTYRVPYDVEDSLVTEYAFAQVLGADLGELGLPADEAAFAGAMRAVLEQTPGRIPTGAIAALDGEFAPVSGAFRRFGQQSRPDRLAAIARALPAGRFPLDQDYLETLYGFFTRNVQAITRYEAGPYAGDIVLIRASQSDQLLPMAEADMTQYWQDVCLGTLEVLDLPGDHFTCMAQPNAVGMVRVLMERWT